MDSGKVLRISIDSAIGLKSLKPNCLHPMAILTQVMAVLIQMMPCLRSMIFILHICQQDLPSLNMEPGMLLNYARG